jgi:lipopolysaccharide transport system ATP-binding protein
MNDLAIAVEGLGKQYILGLRHGRHDTIVDLVTDRIGSLFRRSHPEGDEGQREFWALRAATFEVREGERVGVIGLNGAGKSTLLKLLSRITYPSEGIARVRGRVGALLEVGTGFHPELTGRENVFLYGSILGMSKADIARKFDSIVQFAELHKFVDTPVKRYSSGMYVRLAFSVAAHLEPEILLLDEVLAVGDLPFQRKCIEFAKGLRERDATILFVSHNMFSIKMMCERVIYLKAGCVVFDGPTIKGLELYENDSGLTPLSWLGKDGDALPLKITACQVMDQRGERKRLFEFGERMRIRIDFTSTRPVRYPNFVVAFIRSDGVACCNFSSELDGLLIESSDGVQSIELLTPSLKLVAEAYSISIIVRTAGFQEIVGGQQGASFHVRHDLYDSHFGVFHEGAQWTLDHRP